MLMGVRCLASSVERRATGGQSTTTRHQQATPFASIRHHALIFDRAGGGPFEPTRSRQSIDGRQRRAAGGLAGNAGPPGDPPAFSLEKSVSANRMTPTAPRRKALSRIAARRRAGVHRRRPWQSAPRLANAQPSATDRPPGRSKCEARARSPSGLTPRCRFQTNRPADTCSDRRPPLNTCTRNEGSVPGAWCHGGRSGPSTLLRAARNRPSSGIL